MFQSGPTNRYDGAYLSRINSCPLDVMTGRDKVWNVVCIHINLYEFQEFDQLKLAGGHGTYALINNLDRTIEYFEPNGSGADWLNTVVPVIEQYFAGHLDFMNHKFIPPENVLSIRWSSTNNSG